MKPREVGGLIKKVKVVYLYVCLAERPIDPDQPDGDVEIVGDWFEVPKTMARTIVDRCKELNLTDDLIVDFDEGEKALYVGDPGDDRGEEDDEEETPAEEDGAVPGTEYAHDAEEDDANEEEEETP